MNPIVQSNANPLQSAAISYSLTIPAAIPNLSGSTCLFVQKTLTDLPDRLKALNQSGHLNNYEVVFLQQALLLLQVELSLLPEYQVSLSYQEVVAT